MAKSWDYADLSKLASANGGPQELLKKYAGLYTKKGFKKGVVSRNPVIAAVGVACFALGSVSMWVYGKYKQKRALTTASEAADSVEAKKVEEELIFGMEAVQETESGETVETHEVDAPQEDDDAKEENGCDL